MSHQYVAVFFPKYVQLINMTDRSLDPCRSFARYQGKRFPLCLCKPCADKYLDGCRMRGLQAAPAPTGWHRTWTPKKRQSCSPQFGRRLYELVGYSEGANSMEPTPLVYRGWPSDYWIGCGVVLRDGRIVIFSSGLHNPLLSSVG